MVARILDSFYNCFVLDGSSTLESILDGATLMHNFTDPIQFKDHCSNSKCLSDLNEMVKYLNASMDNVCNMVNRVYQKSYYFEDELYYKGYVDSYMNVDGYI